MIGTSRDVPVHIGNAGEPATSWPARPTVDMLDLHPDFLLGVVLVAGLPSLVWPLLVKCGGWALGYAIGWASLSFLGLAIFAFLSIVYLAFALRK